MIQNLINFSIPQVHNLSASWLPVSGFVCRMSVRATNTTRWIYVPYVTPATVWLFTLDFNSVHEVHSSSVCQVNEPVLTRVQRRRHSRPSEHWSPAVTWPNTSYTYATQVQTTTTSIGDNIHIVMMMIIIITTTMFMVLSSWPNHCESSPGSFNECRLSAGWPPTLRPSQSIWALSLPKNGLLPSTSTIAILIITQPVNWYSLYRPTKGGRLSRPRQGRIQKMNLEGANSGGRGNESPPGCRVEPR